LSTGQLVNWLPALSSCCFLLPIALLLMLLQVGAGFYINATVNKWKNWRMYDYVTKVTAALGAMSALTY
jgi:hypothetical protein